MSLETVPARNGRLPDQAASSGALPVPASRPIRNVCLFVGLSLGVAAFAAATAVAGVVPALLPFVLAIAPAGIALALARHEGGGTAHRLAQSIAARPPRRRWYLALLIPVLATLAVVPLAILLGAPSTDLVAGAVPAIFIVPLVVLLPAFAEELAWRGYALPRLGMAISPLSASLLLGVPWAILHLALFLPGQMYEGIAIWPSVVSVMSLSVICAWLFVGTGGSVLMVGLFHTLFNGTTPLMAGIDTDITWPLRALVIAAVAVAIVILGGFRHPREGWRAAALPVAPRPA